jgi:tryptophanyl-tRNA synthetase
MENKKIIFSGIKPSGHINIGGDIGAISQWIKFQDEYNCIFSVVDYHAITVKQDPEELRNNILEIAKIYLASGIDPKKSIIFQQSRVPAHTELAWIFNCYGTHIADLKKMTQFKDKAGKNQESVSVGLFDYPVLMAADILLYGTEFVPVGEDQVQHVELARDIAKRFNVQFGNIFILPKAMVNKSGARIMGLQNPERKMSKSDDNLNDTIYLLDDPEIAKKKVMRAVTDSGNDIKYDKKNKPAVSNLLDIYSYLSGRSIKELEKDYAGKGYGDFKQGLAETIVSFLGDFQKKYYSLSDLAVMNILEDGAEKAKNLADPKLREVRRLIGAELNF